MPRYLLQLALVLVLAGRTEMASAQSAPASDLDALMAQVLEKRDENWKKLQQYILDEEQTLVITGPDGARYFGAKKEYQWFPRDGFFVRSPVRFDGVAIEEKTRRTEEDRWLRQEQEREKDLAGANEVPSRSVDSPPLDVDDTLRQSLEPQFVQSAYFLRLKFDRGHYALVGPERLLNREVLRIEYYPTKLFATGDRGNGPETRETGSRGERMNDQRAKMQGQLNKLARVTLWVEPELRQILQYELHMTDIDRGVLPGGSLMRVDQLNAAMRMSEPFPNVWLPETVTIDVEMPTAAGRFTGRFHGRFSGYRLASTAVRIR